MYGLLISGYCDCNLHISFLFTVFDLHFYCMFFVKSKIISVSVQVCGAQSNFIYENETMQIFCTSTQQGFIRDYLIGDG